MDLKKIVSVSGYSGLFKVISQTKNNLIVENFDDKKRMALGSSAKMSTLEDIAIFTTGGEVPLKDVLLKIYAKENGGPCIDYKADKEALKTYFSTILPDYDQSRVYYSDMKKLFHWYQLLLDHQLIEPEPAAPESTTEEPGKEEQNA